MSKAILCDGCKEPIRAEQQGHALHLEVSPLEWQMGQELPGPHGRQALVLDVHGPHCLVTLVDQWRAGKGPLHLPAASRAGGGAS